jgi:polyisoprenyl-teichoic acid--peptidoglycan teichoic acid transferase
MLTRKGPDHLQSWRLTLLCIALTAFLIFLSARIAHVAHAPPAAQVSEQMLAVTHTPQPTVPTATPTLTVTPSPTPPPTATPTSTATPRPTRTSRPTDTPSPTVTLTPTMTPQPLSDRRPTAVPIGILPTQHVSATYAIPTVVPRYPIPEEALTVVLLGNDERPDWQHWNTDAIHYVVIYPKIPSVTVLSIPRDLYVYLPGFYMSRINTAHMVGTLNGYDGGGFGLLNQTLLYNMGITADYYAMVNFQGLRGIVDALGGIEVPVHCRIEDHWPYPTESGEYPWVVLEPGVHHMDGKLALWYSRTRRTTSVFDREQRQQQVLEAIWRTARSKGVIQAIPSLYEQYNQLVKTNLGLGNILSLGLVAARLETSQVSLYNIGRNHVYPYVTPGGGGVFVPNWEQMSTVIDRALLPPSPSRAALASIRVEIWNSTSHSQWELLGADRLASYGFTAIPGSPDGELRPKTEIQVYSDHAKGTGVGTVQSIFGVSDDNVTYLGPTDGEFRLRLILGEDYDPCR